METPKNSIQFKVYAKYALFTDPITKIGGEKCSYQIPTYEALKGICKSIYWKPTFIWHIDKVRVMKKIQTQTKGVKPIKLSGGNDLAIYTYLKDVEYQVLAHFEWNVYRPELEQDRNDGKHYQIALRMLEKGGRQDIFLGTRECQGYVVPCTFGEGTSDYDHVDELAFGLMFHSFGYPDETGKNMLITRLWKPVMKKGVIEFSHVNDPSNIIKEVRPMKPKIFTVNKNFKNTENEIE
ncbi:MAG TPA: type I-C CRISPR-associated protein Cas5c [Bacteroidales bacterium]|nr:type I-C CRISPR-associated protein Cas5c [Bacteroidales bacterium]HOK99160.1 type I-C CRISPR-associated protein Cas5c [Bacteroidales bacterium]